MNRENIKKEFRDELGSIAPKLSGIQRPNVLKVPEGYFEQLSGKVMERIGTPVPKVRRLAAWQRVAVAAAVALLMVAGGLWMFQGGGSAMEYLDLASIDSEQINMYLEENLDDLDESLLAEFADIDAMILELDVSEAVLDEYIMDEIDLETLNEELL